jgi:ribosomal protein L11 methylase PrmA
MQSIDFKGKDVFDYGCGTGVLGFFAAATIRGTST